MRLLTSLLVLTLMASNLRGQTKHIYYDAAWQATDEHARYHVRQVNLDDTAWRVDTYNYLGPIIKSGTYRDAALMIPHGTLAWYNEKGYLDSARDFYEGARHGTWLIYEDTTLIEERTYYRGIIEKVRDAATFRAALKEYRPPKENEKESVFPGGDRGWMRYLNSDLKYPRKLIKREVQGQVVAQFIVSPTGSVTDVLLIQSVAMMADDQLLERLKNSSRWEPATIDGRPVNSYKKQRLNFGLQEEGKKVRRERL